MATAFPDTPSASTEARGVELRIAEYLPPQATGKLRPAVRIIPTRRTAYSPENGQAQGQLQEMRHLQLGRLIDGSEPEAYFAVGTMEKAVRKWRGRGGLGLVPLTVMQAPDAATAADSRRVAEIYNRKVEDWFRKGGDKKWYSLGRQMGEAKPFGELCYFVLHLSSSSS